MDSTDQATLHDDYVLVCPDDTSPQTSSNNAGECLPQIPANQQLLYVAVGTTDAEEACKNMEIVEDSENTLPLSNVENFEKMEVSEDCEKGSSFTGINEQKKLIDSLGLTEYFPGKISLQDVQAHSSGKLNTLLDIPWYVLSKILMLDCGGRDNIISETMISESMPGIEDNDLDEMFSQLTDSPTENTFSSMPHPMDVLVIIFWCSSNFFRQILCEKMFMCKLSIPLVLPPFLHEKSMFLLWSLRSTDLESRAPDGEVYEKSLVKHHIPVVSFMRLGEISRSKSRFLNEMVNDQNHDTFFHRDCSNGSKSIRRILSDMLEISWYIPSQQSQGADLFREKIAFMNFRGDLKSLHASKSTSFLVGISNIIIVIIDIDEMKSPDAFRILDSLHLHGIQVVLIFSKQHGVNVSDEHKKGIKRCVESLKRKSYVQEVCFLFDFDKMGEKNIKVLKKETTKIIKKSLEGEVKKLLKIEDYKGLAENLKITVDENTADCQTGRDFAEKIVKKLKEKGVDNLKTHNLPLQCKPWQEWAKLETELHRCEEKGNVSVKDYTNRLTAEKRELRLEQLHFIREKNVLFDEFLNHFSYPPSNESLYLLEWLRLYLNEESKQVLPNVQEMCHSKWKEIRFCVNKDKRISLQKELTELEKRAIESSFGLEHFMREIAQAYEAVHYAGNDAPETLKDRTRKLPKIMAELMLLGYSLELMDGDAAHVPIQWVQAVFKHLADLIGDKKIFVLSVLGIQSSGKSTLLNTMFGLQFPVAAGRCTRGVYVQLIPVCKESSYKDCDYVLVVDTEGLRAAELGKDKLKHDNEIGTFVIGIGDVTIINIKGENISEIEDLFQIVIHALLKMRLVNENLDLQPSCIFIHQNVSAPDASQKLKIGQQKLIETLDKVTEASGKQQDAHQYTQFKQLINFNIDTDIWYFSDLWKGDPPMAPPNSGYSDKICKVKQHLLTEKMQNRSILLTTKRLSTRVKDLWNGILDENFVFSFRNSLEIDAYRSLEGEVSDILWLLKKEALTWLNTKKKIIENNDPDIRQKDLRLTCNDDLKATYNKTKEKLINYFGTSENKSLLEQWRENTFLKLKISYENIILKTNSTIERELAKKQIKINQKKDLQTYISTIMEDAKKLAEDLKNEDELDEEQLKNRFDKKWNEWMSRLPQMEREEINVEERINNALENSFREDAAALKMAVKKRHKRIAGENIRRTIKDHTLRIRKSGPIKLLNWALHSIDEIAIDLTKRFFESLDNHCEEISHRGSFGGYAYSLLEKIKENVHDMKNILNFKDEATLEVCIAIYSCQYVCYQYSAKTEKALTIICQDFPLSKVGIQTAFENALYLFFTQERVLQATEKIHAKLSQYGRVRNFTVRTKQGEHLLDSGFEIIKERAQLTVDKLFEDAQAYIDRTEIQDFREEYVDEIINKIFQMKRNNPEIGFTKTLVIDLAVYVIQFNAPRFSEKHKKYMDEMDQRLVYKRDNYEPCFERFRNFYHRFSNEEALSSVLSERLRKALENAVDDAMARDLADDVKSNVEEVKMKPTFLRAVLRVLIELDDFEEFYLYLTNIDICLEDWLTNFIDKHLYSNREGEKNRYSMIADRNIDLLVSSVCEDITNLEQITFEGNILENWIKNLHEKLSNKLELPLEDLLSLADGYDLVNLETFSGYLKSKLDKLRERIKGVFHRHSPLHHRYAVSNNVYVIIGEECKGCTEKCPFCSSPCSLNTEGHANSKRKHIAIEHYPVACGRHRWEKDNKLIADNCTARVASNIYFKNEKTKMEEHPYKSYSKIYPDWYIAGDPSVEASPYWKWFLVKYEEKLAERYGAERPDIPEEWKAITKEEALASLD